MSIVSERERGKSEHKYVQLQPLSHYAACKTSFFPCSFILKKLSLSPSAYNENALCVYFFLWMNCCCRSCSDLCTLFYYYSLSTRQGKPPQKGEKRVTTTIIYGHLSEELHVWFSALASHHHHFEIMMASMGINCAFIHEASYVHYMCVCIHLYILYLSYQQACRFLSLSLSVITVTMPQWATHCQCIFIYCNNLAFPFADHLLLYTALPISAH